MKTKKINKFQKKELYQELTGLFEEYSNYITALMLQKRINFSKWSKKLFNRLMWLKRAPLATSKLEIGAIIWGNKGNTPLDHINLTLKFHKNLREIINEYTLKLSKSVKRKQNPHGDGEYLWWNEKYLDVARTALYVLFATSNLLHTLLEKMGGEYLNQDKIPNLQEVRGLTNKIWKQSAVLLSENDELIEEFWAEMSDSLGDRYPERILEIREIVEKIKPLPANIKGWVELDEEEEEEIKKQNK